MLQRVTLDNYWMGRDKKPIYAVEVTTAIRVNAQETVHRVNALLGRMEADRVSLELHPNGTIVSSGWRPAAINSVTLGSAIRSKHITGEACDLYDPDGLIDEWCWAHQEILATIDLYIEHPSATKGWCHVQIVPPKSQENIARDNRRRWFYP